MTAKLKRWSILGCLAIASGAVAVLGGASVVAGLLVMVLAAVAGLYLGPRDRTSRLAAAETTVQLRRLMLHGKSLVFEMEARGPEQFLAEGQPGMLQWTHTPLAAETVQNVIDLDPPGEGVFYLHHLSSRRHLEDGARMDRNLCDALLHRRESYVQEYRCLDRHGRYRWLCETVYVRYLEAGHWRFLGYLQDISARKEAEQSMRDVLRQAACIVFYGTLETGEDVEDTANYRWQMSVADNEAAQRVLPLEVPEGSTYLKQWMAARLREDRALTEMNTRQALRTGNLGFAQTFRCRDSHGNWNWISEDVRVEQVAPRMYRWVAVAVNITAQKQTEEALEQARRSAEEASAAKSAFLANFSHEIRTPMTAIMGYADLLGESTTVAEREAYCRIIQDNGQHLMSVLGDILDLSRIESGRLETESVPCDARQIAQDVESLLRPQAVEKTIELSLETSPDLPARVMCDPVRLRQIVMNLLSNAVKFTERGQIRISLSHGTCKDGVQRLAMEVVDTGIGIAPESIPSLFQPFQQATPGHQRRFGGTGLGLSICQRLAQHLGGDITLESRPGAGSTFRVTLKAPAVVGDVEAHESARGGEVARLDGLKVLVADDGADNRRLIAIHLRRLGAEVVTAENGREAIERAMASEGSGSPFHVVLMDMQMPVMDGFAAAMELKQRGYGRAVVALTAHAMEGDRERCLAAGCADYIMKPLDMVQLSRCLLQHAGVQVAAGRAMGGRSESCGDAGERSKADRCGRNPADRNPDSIAGAHEGAFRRRIGA